MLEVQFVDRTAALRTRPACRKIPPILRGCDHRPDILLPLLFCEHHRRDAEDDLLFQLKHDVHQDDEAERSFAAVVMPEPFGEVVARARNLHVVEIVRSDVLNTCDRIACDRTIWPMFVFIKRRGM